MRHTEAGIGKFQTTQRRLAHIHVNIMGSLPHSEGYRYLMIIDRNSGWPEAVPVRQFTAESCVKALIDWVNGHGANFTTLWSSLATSLRTKLIHTTADNPEANSMVEQLHCSFKSTLTARCQGGSWRDGITVGLAGIQNSPTHSIQCIASRSTLQLSVDNTGRRFQDTTEPMTLPDIHRVLENKKRIRPQRP
ncbi:uncharacterized protein [Macrobrachium rosenbergii]|uniref:uncharacterized protein n=1 Tax=Macrobrachium rosenbergii TaxID=79674 RepID=UPI0034D540F4